MGTAKTCVAIRMIQDGFDCVAQEEYPKVENIVKNSLATAYTGKSLSDFIRNNSSFYILNSGSDTVSICKDYLTEMCI
jgi:hypothetical protein